MSIVYVIEGRPDLRRYACVWLPVSGVCVSMSVRALVLGCIFGCLRVVSCDCVCVCEWTSGFV